LAAVVAALLLLELAGLDVRLAAVVAAGCWVLVVLVAALDYCFVAVVVPALAGYPRLSYPLLQYSRLLQLVVEM